MRSHCGAEVDFNPGFRDRYVRTQGLEHWNESANQYFYCKSHDHHQEKNL